MCRRFVRAKSFQIAPLERRAVAARGARPSQRLKNGHAEVLAALRRATIPDQLAEGRMPRQRPGEVLPHVDGLVHVLVGGTQPLQEGVVGAELVPELLHPPGVPPPHAQRLLGPKRVLHDRGPGALLEQLHQLLRGFADLLVPPPVGAAVLPRQAALEEIAALGMGEAAVAEVVDPAILEENPVVGAQRVVQLGRGASQVDQALVGQSVQEARLAKRVADLHMRPEPVAPRALLQHTVNPAAVHRLEDVAVLPSEAMQALVTNLLGLPAPLVRQVPRRHDRGRVRGLRLLQGRGQEALHPLGLHGPGGVVARGLRPEEERGASGGGAGLLWPGHAALRGGPGGEGCWVF